MKADRSRDQILPASVRNARRDRAAWWGGIAVSVLLHALVFVLWQGDIAPADGRAPGRRPPTLVAGGGAQRAMAARLPERLEIPPPPRPRLDVEVPEVEVREVAVSFSGAELPVAQVARLPGVGGGPGSGSGGQGDEGDGYVSPVPRSVLPHWDPPGSVRGMEVRVRVYVDAQGRPTGEVFLDPATPDEDFNRQIADRVRRMRYRPALRHGAPVAGWAEITFIF